MVARAQPELVASLTDSPGIKAKPAKIRYLQARSKIVHHPHIRIRTRAEHGDVVDESNKYRLRTPRMGKPGPVVLAGPTCDSADILYEKTGYDLPLDLECGDRIEILNTGAYTSSYASVDFNGFPPLHTYCM